MGLTQEAVKLCFSSLFCLWYGTNFPRETWAADGLDDFSKRELEPEEVEKELNALKTAADMGALDMNDLKDQNVIREKVNLKKLVKSPLITLCRWAWKAKKAQNLLIQCQSQRKKNNGTAHQN